MTTKQVQEELRAFVGLCWMMSEDMSVQQVADKANLHVSTVYKLFAGETKEPRHSTLLKLGDAVGLELQWNKKKISVKLKRAA